MPHYETIYISNPDTSESTLSDINDKISSIVKKHEGKVRAFDDWGSRKLGYTIEKHNRGHYVLVDYDAGPTAISELEKMLNFRGEVLKFLTVRLEEKGEK